MTSVLVLLLSFAVVYFYLDGRLWRSYTESANRRRKRIEEAGRKELAQLQSAYDARGDVLKMVSRDHVTAAEQADRAIKRNIELVDKLFADDCRILELTEKLEGLATLTDAQIKERDEKLDARIRQVADLVTQNGELGERLLARDAEITALNKKIAAQALDIESLRIANSGLQRAAAIVQRIENGPAETEAITGERFRLQRLDIVSKTWKLVRPPKKHDNGGLPNTHGMPIPCSAITVARDVRRSFGGRRRSRAA